MQLHANQLEAQLKRALAPIYLLSGDEPLLLEECCPAIRRAAQAQGCAERQVLTVEPGFDWNGLYASTQSLSLFAARRLIELPLPTGTPGGAELLAHHMEGNLLAAAQEIEKLALLLGRGEVSLDDIEGNLGDNARFSVFTLADACLRGGAAAILRILNSLRAEGVDPVLVLWALAREARSLA